MPAPSLLDRLRDLPIVADLLSVIASIFRRPAAHDTSIAWEDGELEDQIDPPRDG